MRKKRHDRPGTSIIFGLGGECRIPNKKFVFDAKIVDCQAF